VDFSEYMIDKKNVYTNDGYLNFIYLLSVFLQCFSPLHCLCFSFLVQRDLLSSKEGNTASPPPGSFQCPSMVCGNHGVFKKDKALCLLSLWSPFSGIAFSPPCQKAATFPREVIIIYSKCSLQR
jgi:hypothetical protein